MKNNICLKCNKTGRIRQETALLRYNNTAVKYLEKYYKCPYCKAEWHDSKMMHENFRRARKAYESDFYIMGGDEDSYIQ